MNELTWGDRPRRLDPVHEHSFSSKIGYHIHGPTRDGMWHGIFSLDFLCKPGHDWEVDWDNIDENAPIPPYHNYMAGILVRHISTGRVWKLTGDYSINDLGQEMYEGKWPD
jgi:hypothetical protein